MKTTLLSSLVLGVALTMANSASAQSYDEATCVEAFGKAQELEDGGSLVASRAQLEICAHQSCPEFMSAKCVPWLTAVQEAMPTIVVSVKDPSGADAVGAELLIDGNPHADGVDGNAIELDPGKHAITARHDGVERTVDVVLVAGAKNRVVLVELSPKELPASPGPGPDPAMPPSPAPEPPPSASDEPALTDSALFWAGIAIGGVGLVVGGVASGLASSKQSEIEEQCRTRCTQKEIDDGTTVAHVATAGFAVAGAGTLLALIGIVVHVSGSEEDRASAFVSPMIGVGVFGLRGRF